MTLSADQIAQTLSAQFGPDGAPTLLKGFFPVPDLSGAHRCPRYYGSPKHSGRGQHPIPLGSNKEIGQTVSDLIEIATMRAE